MDYDGGGTVGVEEFCEGVLKAGEVRATVLKWTITDSLADKDKLVFC